MANVLDRQITLDGWRNVVVKWTGVLDSGNISEVPALRVDELTNSDSNLYLKGFRVDMLEYSIGQGIEVQLEWDGLVPQQIFPLAGRGKINAWNYGGFLPDMTRTGYNGSINLKTTGYAAGTTQNFTVVLELVKLYWRSQLAA